MKTNEKIDLILNFLYDRREDKSFPIDLINQEFLQRKNQIKLPELNALLEKLVIDGYCLKHINGNYHISYEGILFIESNKSYSKELRNSKIKLIWNISKIVATVLYSLMILIVGIYSIWVTNKTNKLENELNKKDSIIQKLTKQIDSISTNYSGK
jgi:hypothetical protein